MCRNRSTQKKIIPVGCLLLVSYFIHPEPGPQENIAVIGLCWIQGLFDITRRHADMLVRSVTLYSNKWLFFQNTDLWVGSVVLRVGCTTFDTVITSGNILTYKRPLPLYRCQYLDFTSKAPVKDKMSELAGNKGGNTCVAYISVCRIYMPPPMQKEVYDYHSLLNPREFLKPTRKDHSGNNFTAN